MNGGSVISRIRAEATAQLDRFFTLFFLVTSITIIPTFNSLLTASETMPNGSLLRGSLWASIIAPIMLVVAVYGLAILLNAQWLRLAGIYGLLCIFAKAWMMLVSWLSTSPEYWGIMVNTTLSYLVDFGCIFLALFLYFAWQRRSKIRIERLTYYAGIITSYDLFLVFSFLLQFILFNSNLAGLYLAFMATLSLALAGVAAILVAFKKALELDRRVVYLSIIGFVLPELWATLILLLPFYYQLLSGNLWVFPRVQAIIFLLACVTPVAMVVVLVFTRMRKKIIAKHTAH